MIHQRQHNQPKSLAKRHPQAPRLGGFPYEADKSTKPEFSAEPLVDKRIRRVKQRKILSGSYIERPGEQLLAQHPPSYSEVFSVIPDDGPTFLCPHGIKGDHRINERDEVYIASVDCLQCYPFCVHGNPMDADDLTSENPYSKTCIGCNKALCTTRALVTKHYRMNGVASTFEGVHKGTFTGGGSSEMDRKDAASRNRDKGYTKRPGWGSDTFVDEQVKVDELGFVPGGLRDDEAKESGSETKIGNEMAVGDVDAIAPDTDNPNEEPKDKDKKPQLDNTGQKRCSPAYHIELTWKLKKKSEFAICDKCHREVYKPDRSGTRWKK